jgi:phosphatidylglycerophosphatase C
MGGRCDLEKGAATPVRDERPLVAFDFDGTLTVRDSFMAFLRWRVSGRRWVIGMTRLAPALARYAADRDRERLKTAAVAEFLTGVPAAALAAQAERYAEAAWTRLVRPDALACWAQWRAQGARLAIVTASPEITVAPFARRLGADDLLGTRLALDGAGRIAGTFDGANCRGAEKVERLRARFGPEVRLAAAYGDTSGDTEMLAIADTPGWRVFTGRP